MMSNKVAIRQLRGLSALLVVEFILGITLTTLINYDPSKHNAVQTGFLVTHIVVGVGLLAGAIARLIFSLRDHRLQIPAITGFVCIAGAFASGVAAAKSGSSAAVFLMALFFIIAFTAYGYSMGKLQTLK